MDKEELLTYINEDLVIKGMFYSSVNMPSQISNAIYVYGDYDIKDIYGFIDASDNLDGSVGMIITNEKIYFNFKQAGSFKYSDIIKLSLEKHRNNSLVKIVIKTNDKSYAFGNYIVNPELLVTFLSKASDIDIDLIMTDYELIEHYTKIVLDDLVNDEYEDIELTNEQNKQIQEFYQELELINKLDEENYQYELSNICNRSLTFFDELELDSDEIDELLKIQTKLNEKEEHNIDNAQKYYEEMMNRYQQGDSQMYDNVRRLMESLGINENDLVGKSPEEIQDYLCDRLGIPKSMFEKLAKRFNNK